MTGRELVGLDFETYSACDLRKHGVARYMEHKTFMPLIAAVKYYGFGSRSFEQVIDFTLDMEGGIETLAHLIGDRTIVAHNAAFEQGVLSWMGLNYPSDSFIDSAVRARAAGFGGSLEAAAAQMLNQDKMVAGKDLIRLFSIPGKWSTEEGYFHRSVVEDNLFEWDLFKQYCALDASLSLDILPASLGYMDPENEDAYAALTMDMNRTGWPVDMASVELMQAQYDANIERIITGFRKRHKDAEDLNLFSHVQLSAWCAERGVRAKSFDEDHVLMLGQKLAKKLTSGTLSDEKAENYADVADLLNVKSAIGGSSLKKLQTLIDRTTDNGRLHDSYLHCGAGATYRTTGRGVQMQNLKRIGGNKMAMEDLPHHTFSNTVMGANVRQVFTSSQRGGQLIVGDFASVEARGLAWQANELKKLTAFRDGRDLYKVQAAGIFGVEYEDVTPVQRRVGKVGELSCGYGAGPDAVQSFASKMGVELTSIEAGNLVHDWRDNNRAIVTYWKNLDEALHKVLKTSARLYVPLYSQFGDVELNFETMPAPTSLQKQTGDNNLLSLRMEIWESRESGGRIARKLMTRVIHGVHEHGRQVRYWKPSDRKTGPLWKDTFMHPKTKRETPYTVYGGKLAGLLTQSLCREIFFAVLLKVRTHFAPYANVNLVGQFHDEIVMDWTPPHEGGVSLEDAMQGLKEIMQIGSMPEDWQILPGFPLAAVVKSDYRYTK